MAKKVNSSASSSSTATSSQAPRFKSPEKQNGKRNLAKSMASSSWVQDLRYGQSLSIDFFRTNAVFLLIILVAVLSLIGLRYKTKTKMGEIKKLSHKLELVESEKLQEKAAYMSLIRETEMRRMVREKNLGLVFQEQPPYEVQLINE